MLFAFFLSAFFCFSAAFNLHLTHQQSFLARQILTHPEATEMHKYRVKSILYIAYEKWAIRRAVDFKRLHKYKCRNISFDELILAAKLGLHKSTNRYNGRSRFVSYAEIYVHSELLMFMSRRLKETNTWAPITRPFAMKSTETPHPLDLVEREYEESNLDASTQRILRLKYTNPVRSNAQVAELMCCSEETIRKKIKNSTSQ